MEVYVKIDMQEGRLFGISVLRKCPKIPNTLDEHWRNGYLVYVADLDLSKETVLYVPPSLHVQSCYHIGRVVLQEGGLLVQILDGALDAIARMQQAAINIASDAIAFWNGTRAKTIAPLVKSQGRGEGMIQRLVKRRRLRNGLA